MSERDSKPDTGGSSPFAVSSAAYDRFMGRYARELAPLFADFAGIDDGMRMLDVGCGPGALTAEAVRRTGPLMVSALDPTPGFVETCAAQNAGVDARVGRAEALPYADGTKVGGFDVVAAQLVWHFVGDAEQAAAEMMRVAKDGGVVAACTWDPAEGMQMLRAFWAAALSVSPDAPDEAGHSTFMGGVGPAGAYLVAQQSAAQADIRQSLFERVGSPSGPFELTGVARAGRGVRPRH